MKKLLVIALVLSQIVICFGERVKMKDSQEFEGFLRGKLNGNIYVIDDKLYELPLEYVYRVYRGKKDTTRDWFDADDFQDFEFNDWRYPLEKYRYQEEGEEHKPGFIEGALMREGILSMSEREFAIYQMERQEKQMHELARQVHGVGQTMWTIWGVSILGGLIGGIVAASM